MISIKLPLLCYKDNNVDDKYSCYLHIHKTTLNRNIKIDLVDVCNVHIPGYYLFTILYDGCYFIDGIGYDNHTVNGIELYDSKLIKVI
jgi:hypothetical protein